VSTNIDAGGRRWGIDTGGRCPPAARLCLGWAALCLAWTTVAQTAVAQTAADAPPLVLEHLTTADGLPQGTVFSTLQDSQGFVWLGTEDGLVRYDGHELVRYAYSHTAGGGLPGNFINQIVEDAHHDLWIAIKHAGLARWNRATDNFTVYRHDTANAASLASDAVHNVLVDARGRIWVGTSDAGIDVLDPATGHIEHLRHDPANEHSLVNDQIYTLMLDRSGTLWVGTAAGLDQWQPDRGAFIHFRHTAEDAQSLSGDQVYQVLEDRSGALWVGTNDGGLNQMDRGGRVVKSFRHDPSREASLSNDDVRALLEDRAGHLWVGTVDGLDLLNRETGAFSHYRHDESDAGSLRDSFVMSLYEDASGLVWIGTSQGGVSRWNPRSWEFGGRRPGWLAGKSVTAFADAPDNKLWIASLGGGLVRYDDDTGEATDIDTILGRRNSLGDRRVMSLYPDRHGTLWIGTMMSGLKKLSPDNRLESIAVKRGDPRSLSDGGIMTIFETRNGQLWIGTHDGGANVLDPVTGLVRQLPFASSAPGAVSAASVTAVAEDANGNFWIGTDGGGLDLARPDGAVIKVFRHDPKDPASLPANTVYALDIDVEGRVWIGTDGGGLVQAVGAATAPDSIRFQVMSREEGLSSDTIWGVLSDAKGRLWLSGNAGLMRVDPDTHAVKTYHREQGLQGEEFDFNAYLRLRDGRLCFGGPGGFNIFDPSRLTEGARAPRAALTRLEVLGVPVASATPYWLLDRVAVGYRASIVSLDFAALDFTSPKRNRLAYRVAGLSDRWIDLGTQRRVTLTNLDAGDHLLEVRAANADSVWSDPPLRLTVHRDPAPWRSPWAYAAYALVVVLFIVYRMRMHRANIRRIVAAQKRLESEVALRTRELVESNQQLAEAAQAKSNFLARMSHELRTPMNGVVGMTELLTRTTLSSAQVRLTQTIRSSAQVLLQIVNDLLDLSKIQAGKVEFESLPLDLVRLLEECTTLFAGAAETKGVELIVCPPRGECRELVGDPLRIRQIVMNLVGNAVKFTMQGEVVVKADVDTMEPARSTLRISVADTGVGMDAATIAKIFEPFTQADESTTRRFGGSGLGLAICRELAELMGGSVTVESRPNVGSTFHVALPLQISDESAQQGPAPFAHPVSFAYRSARILTRRPALAESLARHVSALGLRSLFGDCDDPARAAAGEELIIADLSTHEAFVKAVFHAAGASRPPVVVVATTAQIEALRLERPIDASLVVPKPVHREVLAVALAVAAGGQPAAASPATHAAPDPAIIGGHVLLVEDEPVNAAVAQGYLAELGCTYAWVENGPEAIARGAAEKFDLIMMDLNMPTMDGFATTRLIRQREGNRHVPIIALTAHDAKNYRALCLEAGMDDLLSKPYTLEQCAQLLRRWLGRSPGSARKDTAPVEVTSSAAASSGVEALSPLAALSGVDATAVAGLRNLRAGAHADLYSKLVDLFRAGSTDAIVQLESALERDDLKGASAVCHKLASSAANVGALAFARDVRRLEKICDEGDKPRAQRLCERLAAAHPALLVELTRLQLRESA
jgi:signal transduction histidine kinase/ligand-binding sensor domain-containing protein/CheY-like chemotaxis protein/HPt (histidine-containing phosphotransfer) domain-containing protein